MAQPWDLTGARFGKLVATRPVVRPKKRRKWACKCDCGSECEVATDKLTTGRTKSCGCLRETVGRKTSTKHGLSGSPEYRVWYKMKRRCLNPDDPSYVWYGGRGISVCEKWLDFMEFYRDMGPRPSPRHTIERHDVTGNYEPDNCSWIMDYKMQAFNQNLKSNNTSGKSGVYWREEQQRWVAMIFAGGKHKTLGSFKEKADAVERRKAAEVEHYGREKTDGLARVLLGDGGACVDQKQGC